MKIISTNIAQPTTVQWRGRSVTTGIYKTPTKEPIYLDKEEVKGDEVSDRKVHGGIYKACYLFSSKHYPYWKNLYPNLDWNWGMFGENLTVSGLDESKILIGSIYKIGTALVQITQPREPCFKFGIKFGDTAAIKAFADHGYPGFYVKILEKGEVVVGDSMELIEGDKNNLSITDLFRLIVGKEKNQEQLALAVNHEALPEYKRVQLMRYLIQ